MARLTASRLEASGWVPRQPELAPAVTSPPAPAVGSPSVPAVGSPPVPEPPAARAVVGVVAGEVPSAEPAAAFELQGTVAALLKAARIDPGRRGVAALLVVGVVAALIAGVVMVRSRPSAQPVAAPAVVGSTDSSGGSEVVVDVAGAVRRPGLVRLPSGARVDDALKAAGGVLPGTSTGTLNLAQKLTDGQQVLVGVDGGPAAGGSAGAAGAAGAPGALLDLNAATAQDLDALPGIGPVLADHIVAWRTEHGRFASVDQLREVSGIGESKYAQIKPKVRV